MKEIRDKKVEIQQVQTKVKNLSMECNKSGEDLIVIQRLKGRLEKELCQCSNENSKLRKDTVEISRQKKGTLEV